MYSNNILLYNFQKISGFCYVEIQFQLVLLSMSVCSFCYAHQHLCHGSLFLSVVFFSNPLMIISKRQFSPSVCKSNLALSDDLARIWRFVSGDWNIYKKENLSKFQDFLVIWAGNEVIIQQTEYITLIVTLFHCSQSAVCDASKNVTPDFLFFWRSCIHFRHIWLNCNSVRTCHCAMFWAILHLQLGRLHDFYSRYRFWKDLVFTRTGWF